jgi:hypothetical protein
VTIIAFLAGASFDPADANAMSEAYNKACHALHDKGQPPMVQEIIAKQI